MFVELEAKDFKKALSIIKDIEFNNAVNAIIEQKHKGRIWVDHPGKPTIAVFWDTERRFYLSGDFTDEQKNRDLKDLLELTILPGGLEQQLKQWTFYFAPFEWEPILKELLSDHLPMVDTRLYYQFDRKRCFLPDNWREKLPEGMKLELINQAFLENSKHLENYDDIMEELNCWKSIETFYEDGYGFCVVNNKAIVAICIGEYVSPKQKRIEVGIETNSNYRRQGLATLTGSALVDISINKKYSIGWHCWETNVSSAKTAEKIGYKFVQKYPVLYGWYNRVDSLLLKIKQTFESSKDYKKIIMYGEEIVTYFKVHKSVITSSHLFSDINLTYIHLAGAYAQTGNLKKGLEWLRKAIVNGFKDHDTLQRSPLLTPLRKHSRWQEVINTK